MFIADGIQNIVSAGTQQLILWVTQILPQVFLFLILLNSITRLIGQARVERLALQCGSNPFLRYLVLPFLSAIVLGNPMAVSMGRYLPEEYKPGFFASVSYHCHTNSGIFQHINPAEFFLWLGIANGVLARGLNVFPLAFRYLCAGLIANFISGYVTEILTRKLEKKGHVHLSTHVHLPESEPVSGDLAQDSPKPEVANADEDTNRFPVLKETGNTAVRPTAEKTLKLHSTTETPTSVSAEEVPDSLCPYRSITITRGDGGYGGPLTITPTEERHTVLYMTGGGMEPEPLAKILALSGMKAVNGNLETCPDEEVALAIIDCGGTLRCGIYPSKGIPTANLLATGKSGPLAKYMTKDLYVSAVTSAQIASVKPETASTTPEAEIYTDPAEANSAVAFNPEITVTDPLPDETNLSNLSSGPQQEHGTSPDQKLFPVHGGQKWLVPVAAISKVVSIFHQSARDAVKTCLEIILPFMGFAALFIGICRGSGLTEFIADLIKPMGGNLPGLFITGIICSIPGLSAILGAGAVAAQMFATVIGDLIQSGGIAPAAALPALFAINCQCACDFIPVGLGMMEAKPETMQLGIPAVTLSRFATGWIRILIAVIFSFGLYA